jgi:peptide chain release factor 3
MSELSDRRTFAIISHPDAGKTTLTEKLLLYGGAIHQAGSVKARKSQRHATSDWMALEQERGISVTSSVLQFEYHGYHVNLLDTPGHQDFGEDTFRTLVAADSVVMLLDNRKGVEERTRQLFDVCRRRRMPIFTVVNKCDRVGEDPLKLVSDLEDELGINAVAAHWPIHIGSLTHGTVFRGVYDRRRKRAYLFERDERHGADRVETHTLDLDGPDDPRLTAALGGTDEAAEAVAKLAHDIELLDMAGHEFDAAAIAAGEQTPVYFASALTNFGVEPFLEDFLPLAPPPVGRESSAGVIPPGTPAFTAFVFKVQANMDPRHRDRVAFLRVCSGRYAAGLEVTHVRTGRSFKLAPPQQFLGRERAFAEEALPGDVVGVHDRGNLRIGDTLAGADAPRAPDGQAARVRGHPALCAAALRADRLPGPAAPEGARQGAPRTHRGRGGTGVLRRIADGAGAGGRRGGPAAIRRHGPSPRERVRRALHAGEPPVPVPALGHRAGGGHPATRGIRRPLTAVRCQEPPGDPVPGRVAAAVGAGEGGGTGAGVPRRGAVSARPGRCPACRA